MLALLTPQKYTRCNTSSVNLFTNKHFTKISDNLSSTEEGVESGLDEMVIVGQGGSDALGFHDLEACTVGEAPVFVGTPFVPLKRPCELLKGLWKHDYSVAFACVFDSLNRDGSHDWAAVTKRVNSSVRTNSLVTSRIVEISGDIAVTLAWRRSGGYKRAIQ
jgi:hypothetical protein